MHGAIKQQQAVLNTVAAAAAAAAAIAVHQWCFTAIDYHTSPAC
jgi:hypothetical protein